MKWAYRTIPPGASYDRTRSWYGVASFGYGVLYFVVLLPQLLLASII